MAQMPEQEPEEHQQDEQQAEDAARALQRALICGSDAPSLSSLENPSAASIYQVGTEGLSELEDGASAFRLDPTLLTALHTAVLLKRGNDVLACGSATPNAVYDLSLANVGTGGTVEIHIYSTLDADPGWQRRWSRIREAHMPSDERITAAEARVAAADSDHGFLTEVQTAVGRVRDRPADLLTAWASRETHRILESDAGRALRVAEVDVVLAALPDPGDPLPSPETAHVRDAATKLRATLGRRSRNRQEENQVAAALASTEALRTTLEGVVEDLDSAINAIDASIRATPARDDDCDTPGECDAPSELLRREWLAKVVEARAGLIAFHPPVPDPVTGLNSSVERAVRAKEETVDSETEASNQLKQLRDWFAADEALRPIVAHQLPVRFRENVHQVRFGGAVDRFSVDADEGISLVVAGVGSDLSMRVERQSATASIEALVPLMKVFLKFVAGFRNKMLEDVEPVEYVGPFLVPDGVRVLPITGLARHETMTVTLCAAKTCTDETPEDKRRNRITMRAQAARFGGFTFLLDVGANFGSRAAFGQPKYTAFGEPTAGEQLYRLDYGSGLDNRFTVSMLFGVRFGWESRPNSFFFGTGPAFIPKSSGGLRFQWDIRVGVLLFPGVYVTGGLGLRHVAGPSTERIGTIRSVSVDGNGASTAPSVANTDGRWVPVASVGLSIDLGALGSGATDLVKSLSEDG